MRTFLLSCPIIVNNIFTGDIPSDPLQSDIYVQLKESLSIYSKEVFYPEWKIVKNQINCYLNLKEFEKNFDLIIIEINHFSCFYKKIVFDLINESNKNNIPIIIIIPDFHINRLRSELIDFKSYLKLGVDLIITISSKAEDVLTYHKIWEESLRSKFLMLVSLPNIDNNFLFSEDKKFFVSYIGAGKQPRKSFVEMIKKHFVNLSVNIIYSNKGKNKKSPRTHFEFMQTMSKSYFSVNSSAYSLGRYGVYFRLQKYLPQILSKIIYKIYDAIRPYFYKFVLKKKYNRRPAYLPGRVGMSISAGSIPIWISDPSDYGLPFPVRENGPYIIIKDDSIKKIKSEITYEKYMNLSKIIKSEYKKFYSPESFWEPIFKNLKINFR